MPWPRRAPAARGRSGSAAGCWPWTGKTLRGARRLEGGQDKLVGVYDHVHRLVLTQTQVADGDELAAFPAALDTLPNPGSTARA